MPSPSNPTANPNKLNGWILDAYPAEAGEVAVWIITETGERKRLIDKFQPKIYVSAAQDEIERLCSKLYNNQDIAKATFLYKYAHPTDQQKTRVLQLTIKDSRRTSTVTREILRMGNYLKYQVSNCDLKTDREYFFTKDLFPLAKVEVTNNPNSLTYELHDNVADTDYQIPPLKIMNLQVEIAKARKIANFKDPIKQITLTQNDQTTTIDAGDETEKLQKLTDNVAELDPDFVVTHGGDNYLLPYLLERATENGMADKLILSRDPVPLATKAAAGRTFFSYGRVFFKAAPKRLYGRIHVDTSNTFVLSEADFDGLFEIARTCRAPLHTSARNSIGSSMSSAQFYQAMKDDVLIPRNKAIPEAFKSGYDLLVGDRGGFVYEPRVGAHDEVGEVDFSSMYPSIMIKNNISAETVLCKCCPDSPIRIPDLDYNICQKRRGIVPKTLKLIVDKRLYYKFMKENAPDPHMREVYDKRQIALKWILVTCFGYLGYKNAQFGTVDGHMGVCAFGREALLNAAHLSEERGFEVIHGIVDSLWLKKPGATVEDFQSLCQAISERSGVQINFEGRYKWIVFLPSKMHPRVGVLNRYYGAMENGKIKVRGIEIRRRDTPKFIFDAQTEMIKALAIANNAKELYQKIPLAIEVVKKYRQKLINGEIPIWDLIITKHLSKNPKHYTQHVSQAIAAEQLIKEGAEVHAGNSVKFLFTHNEHKKFERRVKAAELVEPGTNPDTKRYLMLLYMSAANLLAFAGYTPDKIHEEIKGQKFNTLVNYLK